MSLVRYAGVRTHDFPALLRWPSRRQELSNRRAPSFSLPDSAMRQHDILDYRGSWLLLDFMKTDCPVASSSP